MIYAIVSDAQQAVKIGYADGEKGVRRRYSDLQVGNPSPLRLIAMGTGDRREEAQLHREWREFHIRGEWFRLDGLLRDWCECLERGYNLSLLDGAG